MALRIGLLRQGNPLNSVGRGRGWLACPRDWATAVCAASKQDSNTEEEGKTTEGH